ncbi:MULTISPECIES: transcription antitermination factor NusB [Protofrankia]|uniref:Transcription antitermination protein NusB n=2 Tax=Protofrankia TaxID=2994361 RepID=F8AZY1_9ACTN|nr:MULTISPECIES: transcription antitermination factor NusB [Protofrankia]AEH10626.1 NusB antitermination factor [Candidatus Protofrankia datiscae]KLL10196.1 antitermination protein NusB [Protofrankia coriariae]ONH34604.1 transcription antitermination factor NusB [Protofrankia sp. BMG5.30]
MSARSKARKRALDILYEADLRGSSFTETLAQRLAQSDPPVPEYTVSLVEGVVERLADIDEMLSDHAEEWTLERMPPVDRNILRIGALELLWREDIPDGVAIDEAVALAGLVSTERSPVFVNGLLARLLDLKLGRTSRS